METLLFEWDPIKANKNIEKHGVSFEEASTVFFDESAILFDDPDHSDDEDRFLIIGFSTNGNMLIVCHCVRGFENIIRVISARNATKTEQMSYSRINKGW